LLRLQETRDGESGRWHFALCLGGRLSKRRTQQRAGGEESCEERSIHGDEGG
jgi:hypothetical protein